MIYLIDWCGMPWSILPWILSGLLGLLAGYLIWAKWKARYAEMEAKHNNLVKANGGLESDLKLCKHERATLEGDIATANGRVREMQEKVKAAEAASKASSGTNLGGLASGFAAGAVSSDVASADNTTQDTGAIASSGTSGASGISSAYKSLKKDNLQIIEGIGPKMESVLKDAGVSNWSTLASKTTAELQAILDGHGDKYKIINPKTWSQQAGLASEGKWDDLILLQKQLDAGNDTNVNLTDSKLEKLMDKVSKGGFGKFKQDDLKIVEGIGPKIAELLNNAGIKTWKMLAESSVSRIQEILDAAGSKYKLANPGSWPQQAGLAAAGKWDELRDLQDKLDGGK